MTREPEWECSKPKCPGPVRPDDTTLFDARYTTGYCLKEEKRRQLVRKVTDFPERENRAPWQGGPQ